MLPNNAPNNATNKTNTNRSLVEIHNKACISRTMRQFAASMRTNFGHGSPRSMTRVCARKKTGQLRILRPGNLWPYPPLALLEL
ncbi:hypothetical protein BOTCAL_0548g00060 [Botryotinia calthae]|uniref:Uncharacterized protein n=1 Tax=Botryotinia calthae TaxID=38488 RepID=A0A4Y8CKS9_9HELO|nr:hypothetical protein BOTCAL_0548g00060 [Botryotinia calthae]